jgi:hypothetical protein
VKEKKTSRKPYKPPTVRTEKLYERAALACTKLWNEPPPRRTCRPGPRNS